MITVSSIDKISNAIGVALLDVATSSDRPILLYAEAEEAWTEAAIFCDEGDKIVYVEGDKELFELILDLWDAAPENQKWSGLEYLLTGDRFQVRYDYGDDWQEGQFAGDRREAVLRRYFGDKPIEYPPLEGAQTWD